MFELEATILERIGMVREQLYRMERKLNRVLLAEGREVMDLDRLSNDVQANTDVVASVQQVVATLVEELRSAAGDANAVNALADQLEANNANLAAAVAAGTPAAPSA